MEIEKKICSKCKIKKEIIEFNKNKNGKDNKDTKCRDCCLKYYNKNKEKILKRKKEYRKENKEKIVKLEKKHYENNKEKILKRNEKYRKNNREKILNQRKEYYQNNKEKIIEQEKKYQADNKEKVKKRRNKWEKKRSKNDLIYKLRKTISSQIYHLIKKQGNNKKTSILKYLPYTIDELKKHLENQFEDWMSWENYGRCGKNKRTWNIDHIIPQSLLLYDSMNHPNFLKCWNLENLRPLEAIENIKKGNKLL